MKTFVFHGFRCPRLALPDRDPPASRRGPLLRSDTARFQGSSGSRKAKRQRTTETEQPPINTQKKRKPSRKVSNKLNALKTKKKLLDAELPVCHAPCLAQTHSSQQTSQRSVFQGRSPFHAAPCATRESARAGFGGGGRAVAAKAEKTHGKTVDLRSYRKPF